MDIWIWFLRLGSVQGGQIYDEGFIVKGENEMRVSNVQVGFPPIS